MNQVGLLVYAGLFCQKYLSNYPGPGILFTGLALVMFLKLVSYMQVNTELLNILRKSSKLAES